MFHNRKLSLQYLVAACMFCFILISTASPASALTKSIRYGPFTLPANTHQGFFPVNVLKPCVGCWVTSITPNVIYAKGATANFDSGIMLHHMVMFNVSDQDLTCPSGVGGGALAGERIFAAGNERTSADLTFGTGVQTYGYKIDVGDIWVLNADIMNMASSEQMVYVEVTWDYSVLPLRDVTPVWLDIDNCADSQYPTAGGYEDIHWSWTSNISGTVLLAGGHVHDGGISIAGVNASTGSNICTSVAGYALGSPYAPGPGTGADVNHSLAHYDINPADPAYVGHIEGMTVCQSPSGVGTISEGDVIDLHTQYNGTGDPGDMGIMMLWVDTSP